MTAAPGGGAEHDRVPGQDDGAVRGPGKPPVNAGQPRPGAAWRGETVILVKGLWVPVWTLGMLARRLRRCGYDVRPFAYRSVACSLRENAGLLNDFAGSLPGSVVHFVGYSLGGIVVEALFHDHPQQRPGRIITIGSPHQGSQAVATVAQCALGRFILGQSLRALAPRAPRRWPWPSRETGTIAGTLNVGLGRLLPGQTGPSDGTVRLIEAQLPEATDRISFPVSHFGLLTSAQVATAVCRFLDQGRFAP
ncbi:MAG: esterase/lipase family protein [Acidiferrobacterales bacterium]